MFKHIRSEDAEPFLDWLALTEALEDGHNLSKAEMQDVVLQSGGNTMLSRHAWIEGLGALVKTAMIHPQNQGKHGLPNLNGIVTLFDDDTGLVQATMDFDLVTKWKTAADSLLAARKLARPESRHILILGAGVVAQSLVEAYSTGFPDAKITVWNRTEAKARNIQAAYPGYAINVSDDLESSVQDADIISCATMTNQPILKGEWLRSGQHIDLIGAYLPDMREADDEVLRRSKVFVDCIDTTVDHIGELIDPIRNGVISRQDILGDFYAFKKGSFSRRSDSEITLHKNGGGAHLDLMTSKYILSAVS